MRKLIYIAFVAVFLSCQNKENQKADHEANAPGQEAAASHHHDDEGSVSLNKGEKWNANPETTDGIANMTAMANSFSSEAELGEYKILKGNLEGELNLIFERCTMTGDAHDQLHNYLMPLSESIQNLESEVPAMRLHALEWIKKHLSEYSNYFV